MNQRSATGVTVAARRDLAGGRQYPSTRDVRFAPLVDEHGPKA